MTELGRVALDTGSLNDKITAQQNRENNRNTLTRSQAKLKDAKDRVAKTQAEARHLSFDLEGNRRALAGLEELIRNQERGLADLTADYRSDLQMVHQLEMDGIFLPVEMEENNHG